jgi:hypothetical protein
MIFRYSFCDLILKTVSIKLPGLNLQWQSSAMRSRLSKQLRFSNTRGNMTLQATMRPAATWQRSIMSAQRPSEIFGVAGRG